MMDTEEYQRLKNKAEKLLKEANMHILSDTMFVGIGLAIEGQAYATLAAAEANRPAPSRRAVGTMFSGPFPIGGDAEDIVEEDEGPVQYPGR